MDFYDAQLQRSSTWRIIRDYFTLPCPISRDLRHFNQPFNRSIDLAYITCIVNTKYLYTCVDRINQLAHI